MKSQSNVSVLYHLSCSSPLSLCNGFFAQFQADIFFGRGKAHTSGPPVLCGKGKHFSEWMMKSFEFSDAIILPMGLWKLLEHNRIKSSGKRL